MKYKIKEIASVLGIILLYVIIFLWDSKKLEDTFIGNILNFTGGTLGILIFGGFALVFIYIIYFCIKSFFKRKVQEEVRKTLVKEKYEQYLREKERNNKK